MVRTRDILAYNIENQEIIHVERQTKNDFIKLTPAYFHVALGKFRVFPPKNGLNIMVVVGQNYDQVYLDVGEIAYHTC